MKKIIFLLFCVFSFSVNAQNFYLTKTIDTLSCKLRFYNTDNVKFAELDATELTYNIDNVGSYVIKDGTYQVTVKNNGILTSPTFANLGIYLNATQANCLIFGSGVNLSTLNDTIKRQDAKRKVDTIYKNAGLDSIIFKINNKRYAIKDDGGGGGASSLFPNGVEYITTSRDFQASDAGKLLVLINASLTMPVGLSILDNKQLGVLAVFNSSTIETSPGNAIALYTPNTGQTGEILLLENTIQEGQSKLAPISSFNINGKTALKHLMDNMGSNSLFPNGVDFVTTSRDFQSSDAGKRLFISGDSTVLTMPEVSPFVNGDIVGIVPEDVDASFTTEFGGSLIYPLKNGDGSISECVVLIATEIDSTIKLFPISTSIILDDVDNKKKTALRYLYEKSQNAIPLSGTEIGKPVTGDIEFTNTYRLFGTVDVLTGYVGFDEGLPFLTAINTNTSESMTATMTTVGLSINTADVTGKRGVIGSEDYSANITDLDYTQKIYVGFRGTATLSSGTVTVTTDKIKTGYKIYLSVNTPSGTQGFLSAPTGSIVNATSFVINSTNAGDNSTVNWWIAP